MALEGVDFRFWHITSIPGLIETAAIEGKPDYPAKSGSQAHMRRSAKSHAAADLPIGARGGRRHHRGTANFPRLADLVDHLDGKRASTRKTLRGTRARAQKFRKLRLGMPELVDRIPEHIDRIEGLV